MEDRKYLSDVIGEEYRQWRGADMILVTAPTGSGKSYFILHVLLKYALENNLRILYLVNRRILKKQLQKDLDNGVSREMYSHFGQPVVLNANIKIMTYHSIEKKIQENATYISRELKQYDYVVYDECHYFYNDATFNTTTQLSFDCLRCVFDEKIQIFMSATIEMMKKKLYEYRPYHYMGRDLSVNFLVSSRQKGMNYLRIKEYTCPVNYDYVKLFAFSSAEDIKTIVSAMLERKEEKWLIFTDNIDRGKKLRLDLQKKVKEMKLSLQESDIIFIDANYENNDKAMNVVDEVAEKSSSSAKVIITTPVMDNGISFHDIELKNIVILADTEESFIQMLGRKRISKDSHDCQINVYICKRDSEHFLRRLDYVERITKFYEKYAGILQERNVIKEPETNRPILVAPYIGARENVSYWGGRQQELLHDIMSNEQSYKKASNFCYSLGGLLTGNGFSIERLYALRDFYSKMADALEEDENAFLKCQMRWLKKEQEPIDVTECESLVTAEYKRFIEEYLKRWIGEKMNSKMNRIFKKDKNFRDAMEYFLNKSSGDIQKEVLNVTRTDRNMTPNAFNMCMEGASLKYCMRKPDGKHFIIEKME